jgi:hypothetical protein
MDYSFIAYVFLCIIIGGGGIVMLHRQNRPYSAVLCFVLFVMVFTFFGRRWFRGTQAANAYNGAWPPLINMCPDYLIYFKRGNTDTCVDISGVNRSGGALKSWTDEDNPSNPPADDAKYFNYVYKPGMTEAQLQQLCTATMNLGLTWEGITNGESCTFGMAGSENSAALAATKAGGCKA